ncbi:MAG: tripartite tricarboxylate transporter substrate-binding protein, partial [Gemmatimonadota bacterium]|nr:tripartite tricarboxylate transporter substrate-binding protein [Gemmatimonadota bacterium]
TLYCDHAASNRNEEARMTATRLTLICAAAALVAGAALPLPAGAQSYPMKPVRVIVPFGPGGGSDTFARLFAQRLADHFGQPFVIENRPGAGALVGTKALVEAAPDGYTIMISSSSWLTSAAVAKPAFDPVNNVIPIAEVGYTVFVLAVHPSLPVKNTKQLIALARDRPGELAYGHPGTGSITHLSMEHLLGLANVRMLAVPYKSGGAVMPDVIAGRTQLILSGQVNVMPHATTGKLRLLGVSSAKRAKMLPDVPPLNETLPGYTIVSWFGAVTPRRTPHAVVKSLKEALGKIAQDPELQRATEGQGITLTGSTIEEIAQQARADYERWSKLVEKQNIRIN